MVTLEILKVNKVIHHFTTTSPLLHHSKNGLPKPIITIFGEMVNYF